MKRVPIHQINFEPFPEKLRRNHSIDSSPKKRLNTSYDIQSLSFQTIAQKDSSPKSPGRLYSNKLDQKDSKLLFKLNHPYHKRFTSFQANFIEKFSSNSFHLQKFMPVVNKEFKPNFKITKKPNSNLINSFITRRKVHKIASLNMKRNRSSDIENPNNSLSFECKTLRVRTQENASLKRYQSCKRHEPYITIIYKNKNEDEGFENFNDFTPW
ncbi:unnamed protein product [Blepharisma stoltei]|uniref:Uncharacterized protein n=1 Tax=Blepharisma stoltei TaxID=1481888 RepID=A0AAU9J2T4_9CILI|nr:unnamed protein product [Blepharisma stoltei]